MAATSCTLVCSEEQRQADKAILVQFSNGTLKNTDHLDFTFYKHIDDSNPRKKNRRIVVAESERLSYVGDNFGTGSLKCNSLCKYYVGVLNKQTMEMEVHDAEIFNMNPVIPGEATTESDTQSTELSYREKVDSLIEAFGTNKQKRALSTRRLNQVGTETLQQAVASAANDIIDQKGLEALQQEAAQTESQGDVSLYLPPCHPDAKTPEEVYLFDDLLNPAELESLKEQGNKMAALTAEETRKLRDEGRNLCVVYELETLPSEATARDRHARCTFYLSLLIKLAHMKTVNPKFWQDRDCPRLIQNKLLRTFTVETFNLGKIQNYVSSSMRMKLSAYCLALLLHMGHMTADLTLLQRDLEIPEGRVVDLARSMGLTVSKHALGKAAEDAPAEDHRTASLLLPLVKHKPMVESRKRKKMR